MNDSPFPDTEALKKRVDALRTNPAETKQDSGQSAAFRIATEMMVCTAVGIFLGYWVDQWLGSKPFGLLVGLMLGMAAGIRSAIRANDSMPQGPDPDQEK